MIWLFAGLLAGCSQITLLIATPTPAYTSTPTKTATPVATDTPIPIPIATASPTYTPTSKPTHTPKPTSTSTSTPESKATPTDIPTATPIPATATSEVPPEPPAADTPLPDLDFRIASWRLWPLELNSGCSKGMHTIFITVLNADGAPLNDIIVGDSWNNVETVTGTKGPGKAEMDLWSNTMEMTVKGDITTGVSYTSEVSFPFSSFMTTIPNEQMVAAGYCANDLECDWKRANDSYFCGGHYSWEVIFQATKPIAR
jgi:hypothetical protein